MIKQDSDGNYIFECCQCGDCCKNLIPSNGKAGLLLFPNETGLFSSNKIKPFHAVGTSTNDMNFRILSYQFTEKTCPYLHNNKCQIYEKRPLNCKAYPVSVKKYDWKDYSYKFDPNCRVIKKLQEECNEGAISRNGEERYNAKKIVDMLFDFYVLDSRSIKQWIFNLSIDRWELLPI